MLKEITLGSLRPDFGSKHRKKRVGRGHGSGHGKTSCRGHKGQKARSGLDIKPFFEGGQTPIIRRVPKRGFNNIFKTYYEIINIKDLAKRFKEGEIVDLELLKERGLVKGKNCKVKLLGDGEINFPLTIKVHAASRSAIEKVQRAGGSIVFLE